MRLLPCSSLLCLLGVAQCALASLPPGWKPRCEIPSLDAALVNRTYLDGRTTPLLIKGATKGWQAHKTWDKQNLLRYHGNVPFHTDPWLGNTTIKDFLSGDLEDSPEYFMGHVVGYGDCYQRGGREYSPFLKTRAQLDYTLEDWMKPMKTFQIGMGEADGIGVPPENHPAAWFAVIKGVKRWVLTSGERANNAGQGTPSDSSAPPSVMRRPGCEVHEALRQRSKGLVCDQEPGDVMWVPEFTWHETCGLEKYNIGIGGVTYEGADDPNHFEDCMAPGEFSEEQMTRARGMCSLCLQKSASAAECAPKTGLEWCGNTKHKALPYDRHADISKYDNTRFKSPTPEKKVGLFSEHSKDEL